MSNFEGSASHTVQFNPTHGSFDVDRCIERLKQKELLAESAIREMCEKVKELLMRESNVVHLSAPVTVVGDIHGSAVSPGSQVGKVDSTD